MRRPVPHAVFVGCVGFYLSIAGLGLWLVHLPPWLGFRVALDDQTAEFRVISVDVDGPAHGRLVPGQHLIAIGTENASALTLHPKAFVRDPDTLRTWEEVAAARLHMEAVHRLLSSGKTVELILDRGTRTAVTPLPRTPVRAFSWDLWLSLAVAAASFLCAASVFAFRPEREANRYFALAGGLLMLQAVLVGAIDSPRLGMSGDLLAHLFSAIHLSEFALLACVAAMSSVYPLKLRFWRKLRPWMLALAMFAGWLDLLHLGRGPVLTYHLSLMLAFGLIAMPLAGQLLALGRRQTDSTPARRFVLALLGVLAVDLVLYLVPPLLGQTATLGRGVGILGLNAAYVGLGFLIYRWGLLDVDRWMIGAWVTFFVGLCLLALDAFVVFLLDASDNWAIAAVMLAVLAWGYFPLRQSAWRLLARRRPVRDLHDASPLLFRRLLDPSVRKEPAEAWQNLMIELFAPLRTSATDTDPGRPALGRGGLEMVLPAVCGGTALVLSYPDRGHRLFTGEDVRLVRHLAGLADRVHHFSAALEQGVHAERHRVAQDLHDEVAPPLLSFIYRCDSGERSAEAREVMRELRGILRELDRGGARASVEPTP